MSDSELSLLLADGEEKMAAPEERWTAGESVEVLFVEHKEEETPLKVLVPFGSALLSLFRDVSVEGFTGRLFSLKDRDTWFVICLD